MRALHLLEPNVNLSRTNEWTMTYAMTGGCENCGLHAESKQHDAKYSPTHIQHPPQMDKS